MIIKKLIFLEIKVFLPLIWKVFCEFEASNYPESAKLAFKQAIYNENYLAMLTVYGAYKDNLPTGIIAIREGGITYLPMKYKYQEFKL